MRINFRVVALGGLFSLCTSCALWPVPQNPNPTSIAARVQREIEYGRTEGVSLRLDFYAPAARTNATTVPCPLVLYVHGGGWEMGDKSMLPLMPGPSELLRRGYAVASINYRLAPEHKFPAMLEDAKCAVRFFRAHAKNFNVDTNRIGVLGDSAGGQLAALIGLTDANAGFEGDGGWPEQSSRVQAVVDLYGPTDFAATNQPTSRFAIAIMKEAFGVQSKDDPMIRRASPVTYVSPAAPPFLIFHGDHDGRVMISQSLELHAKLLAAGASSTFMVITNYSHGFTPLGRRASPTPVALAKIVADFFDAKLK